MQFGPLLFRWLKIRKWGLRLETAYGYGWQGLVGYCWALPRISSIETEGPVKVTDSHVHCNILELSS